MFPNHLEEEQGRKREQRWGRKDGAPYGGHPHELAQQRRLGGVSQLTHRSQKLFTWLVQCLGEEEGAEDRRQVVAPQLRSRQASRLT